jgi:hypothetical protein
VNGMEMRYGLLVWCRAEHSTRSPVWRCGGAESSLKIGCVLWRRLCGALAIQQRQDFHAAETVALFIDGREVGQVSVRDLLP